MGYGGDSDRQSGPSSRPTRGPVDAGDVYSNPRAEFARLERRSSSTGSRPVRGGSGRRHRTLLAPTPRSNRLGHRTDRRPHQPCSTHGNQRARIHAAVPRAVGVAVVAVEHHRRTLKLTDRNAEIHFVRRDLSPLDLQRHRTELGQGWVTTIEQTLLDLIARPSLGGVPEATQEGIESLIRRADVDLLRQLAVAQRRRRALAAALDRYDAA